VANLCSGGLETPPPRFSASVFLPRGTGNYTRPILIGLGKKRRFFATTLTFYNCFLVIFAHIVVGCSINQDVKRLILSEVNQK